MPKYELMYVLGSHVAENDIAGISAQVLKAAEDYGGRDIKETQLGKKKLSYPIKKTRNGHYIVVNFEMDGKKINEFDAKIRTMGQSVIRYIIVNLEEHLLRQSKDKVAQAQLNRKQAAQKITEAQEKPTQSPDVILEDIDEKTLDEKIEKALSEDLTK